jgi:serine/threonine protein kinase
MASIRLNTSGMDAVVGRAPKLPIRFGAYELVRALGYEPDITAYIASVKDAGRERRVLLKCLNPESALDARALGVFRDRTRLARSLDHRSLPRVVDSGSIEGRPFLAFEHVPGVTLKRVATFVAIRSESVPEDVLCRIAIDLLDALAYAHTLTDDKGRPLDIVHRDVSPENVVISLEGLAMLEESSLVRTRLSTVTTETGIVKGRFAYLAPEQVAGESVDARADLWSLGVVMWEAIAGRALFAGPTGFSSLMSSMVAPIPRLVDLAKVTPALSAVVERALQRAPDGRFATASEMAEAIRSAVPTIASREDVSAYIAARFPEEIIEETTRIDPRLAPVARPAFPLAKRQLSVRWLFALVALIAIVILALREVVPLR